MADFEEGPWASGSGGRSLFTTYLSCFLHLEPIKNFEQNNFKKPGPHSPSQGLSP